MADKICDHTSVGVLLKNRGRILIIERKRFPAGFALPAGHLDGDSYAAGAARELREETGIESATLEHLLSRELANPCRRAGGTHHQWQVFRAPEWHGTLKRAEDETKSAEWAPPPRLAELARRTEAFAQKYNLPASDLARLTPLLSEDPEWQQSPGLEPVWYYLLKELNGV